MNNEEFDHITKMKLQDYAAAIPEGLWEKIHVPTINPPTEQFDQFIQQKLFDYSAPVSPEVWNRIKPKEDEDKKIFFLLPRAGMVAASILLLILAGSVSAYLYYQKLTIESPTATQSNNPNNQRNNKQNSNTHLIPKVDNETTTSTTTIKEPNELERAEKSIEPIIEEKKSVDNKIAFSKRDFGTVIPKYNQSQRNTQAAYTSNLFGLNNLENNSKGIKNNTVNSITELDESKNESSLENEFIAHNKLDASLIGFSKNKLNFNSKEKQVTAFNHTSNIKNVVICPSDRKMRNPDWDLEIYASPDYAFKTVSSTSASKAYMDRKDSSEKSQVSFTAGIRIVKPINDHFSLKTGLQYSQINEHFTYRSENEIKTTTVVTVRTITLANGNTVTVSDTSVVQQIGFKNNTVKNRYKSFDIPALVSYQFGNDDLRIGINAGVIFNLSSWYQGVVLDTSLNATPITKETNISYKNNIGMGIYTGISITKRLNYNTSIFAEPYLRYNLSDMTTPQSSFNQRFSVGGLSIGLRMNLNNR
ncbi:MAG: hypothetical protein WCP74_00185 [Sphingobacteriia bacterium]